MGTVEGGLFVFIYLFIYQLHKSKQQETLFKRLYIIENINCTWERKYACIKLHINIPLFCHAVITHYWVIFNSQIQCQYRKACVKQRNKQNKKNKETSQQPSQINEREFRLLLLHLKNKTSNNNKTRHISNIFRESFCVPFTLFYSISKIFR